MRTGRLAGPSFVVVVLVSVFVLFAPSAGGSLPFPGADKAVHLALFAVLAVTTRWRFGAGGRLLVLVAAYGVVSELVQALGLAQRSGDVRDVAADLVGAGLGWWVAGRSGLSGSGPPRAAAGSRPAGTR